MRKRVFKKCRVFNPRLLAPDPWCFPLCHGGRQNIKYILMFVITLSDYLRVIFCYTLWSIYVVNITCGFLTCLRLAFPHHITLLSSSVSQVFNNGQTSIKLIPSLIIITIIIITYYQQIDIFKLRYYTTTSAARQLWSSNSKILIRVKKQCKTISASWELKMHPSEHLSYCLKSAA